MLKPKRFFSLIYKQCISIYRYNEKKERTTLFHKRMIIVVEFLNR